MRSELLKHAVVSHFHAWVFFAEDWSVVFKASVRGTLHPDKVLLVDVLTVLEDEIAIAAGFAQLLSQAKCTLINR